jgi:sRNA-binding protein
MLDLGHLMVEVPCPRCGYGVEIQFLDARTQTWRWCPCCRVRIRMVEPDGSVSGSIDAVEDAMQSLAESIRRMSR